MSQVYENPDTVCGPFDNYTMLGFLKKWREDVKEEDHVGAEVIGVLTSATFVLPFFFTLWSAVWCFINLL